MLALVGNLSIDRIAGAAPRIGGGPYHAARALRLLGARGDVYARCADSDRRFLLPRLAAQRSGSSVLLSWPAAYSGWSLYTEPALTGAWTKSSAPLLLTNDLNTVSQSPSNPAAFFQLHKPPFCSPFE